MGLFNKSFSPKKAPQRRSASLNNLVVMDPTIRQREFHPDPENVCFVFTKKNRKKTI